MSLVKRNRNTQVARSYASAVAPLGIAAVGALVAQKGVDFVFQQAVTGAIQLSKKASSYLMRAQSGQVARISSGDVSINPAPVNMGAMITGSAKFQGDIRVRHRELVRSLVMADTTYQSLSINPARTSTFPYLSTLGRMYDQYTIHSARVVVVSSSPTSSGGRYYVAWDPDSTEINANDPGTSMAMQHSVSATAWQTVALDIPPSKPKLYCDAFPDTVKDHGAISFLSRGTTATVDIYMEYDVSLHNPEVSQTSQVISRDVDTFFADGIIGNSVGPTYARQLPSPVAKSFQLAPGIYQIVWQSKGSSLAEVAPTVLGAEIASHFSATNGGSNASIRISLCRSNSMMTYTNNDTGTLTDATVTITPMARGGFDMIYNSI
nr:structural protein [Tolivirales sp.]